ncbi:helix-turn-helix domain-containing protein [Microvirga arabica]|uniref:helix-turn-helix domain-containing protein n=1 Tax=Microvirga arabica TaxID=1128671 RepID=UPI0019395137|nr:helix-turn-helix domain-containing protein [Microvirga arabica]MBM1175215.1 helix-turn-helix transcriptional regulator [Microvirga arabica]
MTRKSFSEDDFTNSVTLQNVSANLDLIRRLERLSLAELGKRTGLSDRHLDSLIRMTSNVTVLVLEQIAERLNIPFLTFIGSRLDATLPGGWTGFLDRLKEGKSSDAVDEDQPPSPTHFDAVSPQQLPSGLTPDLSNLLQHLITIQERQAQDQAALTRQVENLTRLIERAPADAVPSPRGNVRPSQVKAGPDDPVIPAKSPKTKRTMTSGRQSDSAQRSERTVPQESTGRKTSGVTRSSRGS